MANIPIREIPTTGTPTDTSFVAFDDGVMKKATVGSMADAVRPFASEGEATAGSENTKVMTALRTSQFVAGQVGVSLASKAQGDLANTAVQPGDLGTAAAADVGDFATAAQGALADSAVQPGDLGALASVDLVTSALLASDVFSTAHSWSGVQTFTNPVVGTQSPGDNSTKAASTSFVQAAIAASGGGDLLAANNLSELTDPVQALDNLGIIDLSKVPVVSGVGATEVADFANGFYWLNGRQYPSLMSWLHAGNSTFRRASTAWKQDSGGRYFPVYNDAPRLSYDASGTSLGVLIEGAITNRATYTEDFSNAIWTKSNCSIAGVTLKTPDGVSYPSPGAYIKMVENSSNSIHSVYQQCSNPANAAFTAGCFVKAGTRTKGRISLVVANNGAAATFDLTAGTINTPTVLGTGTAISSSIRAVAYGWYYVSVTGKVGTGATNAYIQIDMRDAAGNLTYTGDGASYLYIWGAQVEGVALPTSYVPVRDGTAVNRSNEILYRYLNGQPAAITKVLKARTPIVPPQAFALLIHMDDGSEANDFEVYQTSTGHIMLQLRAGWVEQGTIDLGYVAPNTDFKIAYRGSATDFAASINGGTTLTSSLTEWPLTMETERYGVNATETFDRFWYSTIAYQATIPVAASDSDLQALSS